MAAGETDGIAGAAADPPPAPAASTALVVVLAPLLCGVVSVLLGKDANWDLRNYHYYNAYAFLRGRLGFDIAPAQLQTFYNPLLDLPFYLMAQRLPAAWIGFALGCAQGLCLSFLYLIWLRTARFPDARARVGVGVALLAAGAAAPGFLYQLGGTMNDNTVSLFVVAPLFLLLVAGDRHAGGRVGAVPLVAAAGFVMGAGVGMKPSAALYALGSALALPVLFASWRDRARFFVLYGAAGAAGGAASAGWWCWELWTRHGNPVLPFFNDVFRSPYVQAADYADRRFGPRAAWEPLVWPLVFLRDPTRVSELTFADLRFAVVYLQLAAWAVLAPLRRPVFAPGFDRRKAGFLLAFFALSFLVWMRVFPFYRYLITLELLAPLVFALLLATLVPSGRGRIAVAVGVAVAAWAVFKPLNYGRVPWSDPYVAVDGGGRRLPDRAVVVMLGGAPLSYVIPHFPPSVRFVRSEGNLHPGDGHGLTRDVREAVAGRKAGERVYVLFDARDRRVDAARSLERLGLGSRLGECRQLRTGMPDDLRLCRVPKT